ncbi:hypothetical protein NMY22_g6670 [Coprinellus aureogranulatus]|nr:hypothetical protein NMY22_g6670 [Coprinellus aureogranulatus]
MYSSKTPTPSSMSVNTTTTTTSQSPMLPKQSKDYDASLAQLSSQYGFPGGVPVPSSSRSSSPSSKESQTPQSYDLNRWENAYAQLSGQYGFGSTVSTPSLPKRSKPSTPSSHPTSQKAAPPPSLTSTQPAGSGLNRWEAAYGDLSGQYGFGGAVPVPSLPSKKDKTKEKDADNKDKPRRFGLGPFSVTR